MGYMKAKLLGLIACTALFGVSQAGATTYYVDDTAGSLTLIGSITTDSHTGILSSSDIQSWDLSITGFGTPPTMTLGDSILVLNGDDLSATTTTLSFNFADAANGVFAIGNSSCYPCGQFSYVSAGAAGGINGFFALQTSPSNGSNSPEEQNLISTEQVIASTPLPAALPLFATALGGLGLLGWRRKRKNTAAIAA
jgi:hypothetical protein